MKANLALISESFSAQQKLLWPYTCRSFYSAAYSPVPRDFSALIWMQCVFRGILKADWTNAQEDNSALAMRGTK